MPCCLQKINNMSLPPKANLVTCLPQSGSSKRPHPSHPISGEALSRLWMNTAFPLEQDQLSRSHCFPGVFKFESVHISEWLLQVLEAAWRPVRSAREASSGGQLRRASSVWCEAARGRNARLARTTSESAGKQTSLSSCFHHSWLVWGCFTKVLGFTKQTDANREGYNLRFED